MGITLAYRGRLADLTRIEDFEDRLLDFALEVGGMAQIWRTQADDDPRGVIRGIILNVAPGLEPASLLISPDGWLIGLTDIEGAEHGRLTEPPWCFIKTQFGPLEGHVTLVEMLLALKCEFIPDLELSDDGGYLPNYDLAELTRRRSQLNEAVNSLFTGLERHGLSREAAEDPEILLRRIERIATQVHRILRRPAEHPPVRSVDEDDALSSVPDPETVESVWDALFKQNRRQQERLQRALEERRSRGQDDDTAFDNALQDIGLEAPDDESGEETEPWRVDEPDLFDEPVDEANADGDEEDDAEERHPLLKAATDLLLELHSAFRDTSSRSAASLSTLFQGAGDTMGGLAQALSRREDDSDDYGLRVTQLKRALRGAAFARGALFPLRGVGEAERINELHSAIGKLADDIFHELSRVRAEHREKEY